MKVFGELSLLSGEWSSLTAVTFLLFSESPKVSKFLWFWCSI